MEFRGTVLTTATQFHENTSSSFVTVAQYTLFLLTPYVRQNLEVKQKPPPCLILS